MKKVLVAVVVILCLVVLVMGLLHAPKLVKRQHLDPEISTEAVSLKEKSEVSEENTEEKVTDNKLIIWAQNSSAVDMVRLYQATHPECNYVIIDGFGMMDADYSCALKEVLEDEENAPDIFFAADGLALEFSRGEASKYVVSYEDLGIDCTQEIEDAEIAPYVVEIGSNPDTGKTMGLSYESNGGAFIYRRSIAKKVFGTDDPETIKTIIGPGFDQFFTAAEELKKAGYCIVSGVDDIAYPIQASADLPWFVDGEYNLDPKREALFEYAKKLTDNGYHKDADVWTGGWYDVMKTDEVFGLMGPSWMIEYTMESEYSNIEDGTYGDWAVCEPPENYYWGGAWVFANQSSDKKEAVADILEWMTLDSSETGLQYQLANGELEGENSSRQSVASTVVMRKANGESALLGGQNMYEVFCSVNSKISSKNATVYDEIANYNLREQAKKYARGEATREQALLDLKTQVEQLKAE